MDAQALAHALTLADAAPTVRDAAASLRQHFNGLRVVVVDALDMRDETPAAQGQKRNVFLGASDGHCWHTTADPSLASALFVADRL